MDNRATLDGALDEALSTWLMHHLSELEAALREMRRVVRVGGQITIGMPTDSGMFNQFVKVFVRYPQMRRIGVENF